ncbi:MULTISPECIES: 5-carboxymethyl-2-hydroxymuconate Delta-isomerase [unclassified Streptomyces]|uniref:5-carboxymethyl-2-hydroxymuconate Delta-isomerase n=1 Tax=unclassified Streptomyces TaxID=2593676 RepID=UPI0008DD4CE0|nr:MULTISPECIES: isomerase [unclassified Streptomyces]OII70232.1 isomerase [Streptomyces sp. CC77]
MPQITIDYSDALGGAFDRRGYAAALHPVVAETVSARLAACTTRTRATGDTTVGDGTGRDAAVHVEIALLPGRAPEAKARLSEAAVGLVRDFLTPVDGVTVHVSAEVRDLDVSYRAG